jgi:multiple sugar transport system permease protein
MNGDTLQTKQSFWQKVGAFFEAFGNGFVNFFVSIGKGIKFFFKNPKEALKITWKFLKKQNGWLFLLPALFFMAIFTFYPIVNSLIEAFRQDYDALAGTDNGFGFGNFIQVIEGGVTTGADFKTCLVNTLILAFISVPLSTIIALLISVALNSIKVLQKAYQTIFFLPYLTNALAMGAVFATFFNIVGSNPMDPTTYETAGLVNNFLGIFNIAPVNWMNPGSETWANYVVITVYSIWSGLPFKILILFSALQNVGKQYYDAAKIDGASKGRILSQITVPLISPMISYLITTGLMGALKSYSSIVGIFGASMGPSNDYEMGTMVGYIYSMIENNYRGHAAAGSLILFVIIMIFTAINLQVSKKRVHY